LVGVTFSWFPPAPTLAIDRTRNARRWAPGPAALPAGFELS
jgi:hypothetical protein